MDRAVSSSRCSDVFCDQVTARQVWQVGWVRRPRAAALLGARAAGLGDDAHGPAVLGEEAPRVVRAELPVTARVFELAQEGVALVGGSGGVEAPEESGAFRAASNEA